MQRANDELIAPIDDLLKIQPETRQQCPASSVALESLQQDLRAKLA